jgi:ABC-type lipoprotein release transport system permease subunit
MFRNIIKNKKNSITILLLIAFITFLFFIGNSVLNQADIGMKQAYVETLTADVMLQKTGDVTMNLFGANTPVIDSFFTIPSLPAYDAVLTIVSAEPGIAGITSQVSSTAYLDLLGVREAVLLCGADADSYFPLFPGIILEEGRLLKSGEYGAMITAERADRLEEKTGARPSVGMPLLFTSGSGAGFKIREVPLVGIYRYQNSGQYMEEIIIIDPQTARVLSEIQVASSDVEVSADAVNLLEIDLDNLFDAPILESSEARSGGISENAVFSVDTVQSFLSESREKAVEIETVVGGDWNFILLKVKKGVSPAAVISSLNKKLKTYEVHAVDWRIAAGTSAILLLIVQSLFNTGVTLVSIAGIIVVINILLISVFLRTREIGTLRAIGASNNFIRFLVLGENITLSLVAGIVGVAGGIGFLQGINKAAIKIPNALIASLLGGDILSVAFLPNIALISFVIALVLGIAVSLYPVETAVRIAPIVAVQKG